MVTSKSLLHKFHLFWLSQINGWPVIVSGWWDGQQLAQNTNKDATHMYNNWT